jgi:hypothetical protein
MSRNKHNQNETKVEETKVEETKVEETKVEETKVEETKVEETKVEETVVLPPYYVAKGKAITCKKGVLSDGDEVCINHLGGGKDTIDKLVKSGHVIKS